MKRLLLTLPATLAIATPANATGGMVCRTAGSSPIAVSVGFGHTAGAALLTDVTRLSVGNRNVPVTPAQWWLDKSELRLLLTDPQAQRVEALIKAKRTGQAFDGNLWRGGRRFWVRCRED